MTTPAFAADGEMLDQIRLIGLRAKGFHGVFEHERREGQEFVVDVVVHLDTRAAAARDELAATVDYGGLAIGLADIVRGEPVDLIERLAQALAERCLEDPRVQVADITVHKPSAPIPEQFGDVAVTIRRSRATVAVLALGANLGDRLATLQAAVDDLRAAPGIEVVAVSPVVETDPVGGPEQPDYLNAVVQVRTTLSGEALLAGCHRIEQRHGRVRESRWAARTLDIDVITFGELVQDGETLQLPHPRAAERAFVLVPWAALDPDATLPGMGRVTDLALHAPDHGGLRHRPDLVVS